MPSSLFIYTLHTLRRYLFCLMLGVTVLGVTAAARAQSVNLTPEQLSQLQSLTPAQREALLRQLGEPGFSPPTAPAPAVVDEPLDIPPRATNPATPDSITQSSQSRPQSNTTNPSSADQAQRVPLEQFGYSLFAGVPTTFAPATNIPVPANYIMGPGDTVIIQLYGQQNVTHELVVSREGQLLIPETGPLSVAGLNFDELRALINETVSTQLIGQRATVTLGTLRSIRIFVLGEAYRPGSYTVSALSTMTNALLVSGGITNVGSLRNVQLRRAGVTVGELDLYDLLLRGDTSNDQRLMPDDVLFIPPIGTTVGVSGEVIRPAIYELKDETTAAEVIELAGGMLPTAFPGASRIERIDASGNRTLVNADLASTTGQALALRNGDVLQVDSVLDQLENIVTTEGHLRRAGGFQWRQGLRVSDVIPSVGALLPNPDLTYALVVREVQPTRALEVHRLMLGVAIANPGSEQDLVLAPRDRIITFAANGDRQALLANLLGDLRAEARLGRPAPLVDVQGNVRFPGTYPLLRDMTLGDLIDSAAGLEENTDASYSLVMRKQDERGRIQPINPRVIAGGQDLIDRGRTIQAGDSLLVFNNDEPRATLLAPFIQQLKFQADSVERSRVVTATGQVKYPGEYPLYDGMTVDGLIRAAGGLNQSALTTMAEISRYMISSDAGRRVDHFEIDLTLASATGRQLRLAEFDNLVIRQLPNWVEPETIVVAGEVVSPGTYTIAKGDSLSSVIQRAGGLTSFADPRASVLLRDSLREQERATLAQYQAELQRDIAAIALQQDESGTPSDAADVGQELLQQVEAAEPLGRLVIDLPQLLAGDLSQDVMVRGGDQLFIPRTRQEVSIMGEVNFPTSHLYDPRLSVTDYINLSGGLTQRSDARRTYIIKASGKVMAFSSSRWFFDSRQELEPGDTIVVPFDLEPSNNLATWTSVTQILFNLATSVLAIESVRN